jgi:prepilin-type N-terminal cleavage/methylation domain-containing protein
MARRQKQSGFTVVEVLLVLILIAIVAFAGYYVWNSQQNSDKPANTASKNATTQSHTTNTPAKTVDETAAIKVAVVAYNQKQFGDDLKDATINIEHQNDTYALGGITASNGDSGGQWFAKKENGSWAVLSQGTNGHCDELAAVNLSSWDSTCTTNKS